MKDADLVGGWSDRHGSGPGADHRGGGPATVAIRDGGAASPGSVLTADASGNATAASVRIAPAAPAYTDRDHQLPATAAIRIARAVPKNTQVNYSSRWRSFESWCSGDGRVALPATPETLAAYLDYLATARDLKASTLEAHASAVRARHRAEGFAPPENLYARKIVVDRQNELAEDAEETAGPHRALPIVRADLPVILEPIDHSSRGTRDRAVILLGWALMLRTDEVVRLNRNDVTHIPEEGIKVRIRRSKTDNKGVDRYVPFGPDRTVCPARATLAWIESCRAEGVVGGALFRPIDQFDNIVGGLYARAVRREARLSTKSVAAIITSRCEAVLPQLVHAAETATAEHTEPSQTTDAVAERQARADVADAPARKKEPKASLAARRRGRRRRYSGHSVRRGGATSMIRSKKVTWIDVSRYGRWADGSRSFAAYIEEATGFDEKNPVKAVL